MADPRDERRADGPPGAVPPAAVRPPLAAAPPMVTFVRGIEIESFLTLPAFSLLVTMADGTMSQFDRNALLQLREQLNRIERDEYRDRYVRGKGRTGGR